MVYNFESKVSAFDCLIASLYHTYNSMAGVINIVFTGSMIGLAFKFWATANLLQASIILFGCFWFPVIVPIGTYLKHKRSLKNFPAGMELGFNDYGMQIKLQGEQQSIPWKKLSKIAIEPNMVIIYSDNRHGYMLSNKNMGLDRKEFISYLHQKAG